MECSCNAGCNQDDDDYLGYSKRKLKAGKDHTCCECKGVIAKGSDFYFCSIFRVDSIGNYTMCPTCHAIVDAFFKDGFVFHSALDDLGDYLFYNWKDDLPSNCISKLPTSAQAMVCDILQDFQEN
jgi:hypothetical protein